MDSNYRLEEGPIFIAGDIEAARLLQDDESMNRIEKLTSPRERLLIMLRSVVMPYEMATHEGKWIGTMTAVGFFGGLLFGGIIKSADVRDKFLRIHNASVFDNKYLADRAYRDGFILNSATKGLRYAIMTSIFSGTSGLMIFGSMVYRNKLYLPDWLVGFSIIGAASRFMLGPRAMAAGALFGAPIGLCCYGVAKGFEIISGESVAQRRYANHQQYLSDREAKRLKNLLSQQQGFVEVMSGRK